MSGYTSTASTQPFTDSAEVWRRVAEGIPSPNQPSYDASTQAFTDSTEVRRRAGLAAPEPQPQHRDEPAPEPGPPTAEPSPPQPPPSLPTAPLALSIQDLADAFASVSLATSPNARLVLACPTGSSPDGSGSVIIRLPTSIGGWDTVGIVQRTRDVDFVLDLPFWVQTRVEPPFELIPQQLKCRIYYDPVSDKCLLVNESVGEIHLTRLTPSRGDPSRLLKHCSSVLSPGIWRISILEGDKRRQHVLDFCVLQRQFAVDISEAPTKSPVATKRPASESREVDTKRRRFEGDVSEILLAPAAAPLQAIAARNVAAAPGLSILTPARTRQITHPGIPLLDLQDGEVAIVRITQSKDTQASHVTARESYTLQRVGGITNTAASSVFVGSHSEVPERIVAKVVRYKGMSSVDLIHCAQRWQQEKDILEKLRHRSIVSLKAFDGRFFAVYLERLPSSLHRGINSPFRAPDAFIILRDISSALSYLETQHIAHNDIKPANITYSPQRGAVLIDFEMATFTTGDLSSGGTPWYLPPEYVESPEHRGASADIWALGVTMLYVLGNIRLPEKTVEGWLIRDVADKGKAARGKMEAWLHSVAVKKQGLDCADKVQRLVYRMLEKEPEDRVRAEQVSAAFDNDSR